MNVVVEIAGCKALPVWALPYVTSWHLSPDALLLRLVNPQHDQTNSFPAAFNLGAHNEPFSLPSEQWEGVSVQIKSLDAQLRSDEKEAIQNYNDWRNKHSVGIIRKYRAYVWLDEFEKWFDKELYAWKRFDIDENAPPPINEADSWKLIEKPGLKLCLSPLLDDEDVEYFKAEKAKIEIQGGKKLRNHVGKPKTMLDVECLEATKFIKLPFFLDALEFSPLTKGSNPTEVFFLLLEKGLRLYFSEPGYCFDDEVIPNGDVKYSLKRIDRALLETDIPRMKLFSQEVIKTEAGSDIPMAGILIGREDVRRLYDRLGFDLYPWVKIPWPTDASDFEDCPTKANFSEKYQTQFGRSFWDDEAEHDDEFSVAFEALANPNLADIGFCKDDVTALFNKIPHDALLVDRQNAAAEIAALRPEFFSEYKKIKSSDLITKLEPLPENPTFQDRTKRYIWINILNKRKVKVDADAPSEARFKELEQLNQTITEIQRQLGLIEVGRVDAEQLSKREPEEHSSPESEQQEKSVEHKDTGSASKKRSKTYEKRLDALREWLISLNYTLDNEVIILPKQYTLEKVYTELGKYTEQSKNFKGLFSTIEISTFDSHFWGKQKIVELMRGNKSAIL
jgi:hypothetical protein